MLSSVPVYLVLAGLASTASAHIGKCMVSVFSPVHRLTAHIAFWHKSMYGFNVTDKTFSYDNRPQVPLYDMTFDQWWLVRVFSRLSCSFGVR